MKLTDYSENHYSQFGEDGMIRQIFERIGRRSSVCVEFGAADGESCSNTKHLWDVDMWRAVLVEQDDALFKELSFDTRLFVPRVSAVQRGLTPTGPASIDNLLAELGVTDVDLMSIDIDGIEYQIWESMIIRPRVVIIEYNQSIPPHVSLRQANLTDHVGASARALVDLGSAKGYELIGLTKGNLLFVVADEAGVFADISQGLDDLFIYSDLCFLGADQKGRGFAIGEPPWGLVGEPFVGELTGADVRRLGPPLDLIKVFERRYKCRAIFISQQWKVSPSEETSVGVREFTKLFERYAPLIIMDVANQQPINRLPTSWVALIGQKLGYELQIIEGLFVFTRNNKGNA